MTPRTALFALAACCVAGIGYIVFSDQYGRPARPERPALHPPLLEPAPARDPHRAEFSLCIGPVRANCVVDGDTYWFEGEKIRIADIDAPEITQASCADERRAGESARRRLLELLNEGAFSLIAGWRDEDRYGRKLRIVARGDRSLGEMLVREGLARHWDGPQWSWCG